MPSFRYPLILLLVEQRSVRKTIIIYNMSILTYTVVYRT